MEALDIFDVVTGVADTGLSIGSLVAKVIPTHRECRVELSNDTSTYVLTKPCVFIKSGHCSDPLPPSVQPAAAASALFSKTPHRAQGSIGVFTYDLCGDSGAVTMRLAVMFKVPFNKSRKHPVKYGVGLFAADRPCDCALYQEMADGSGTFESGGAGGAALSFTRENVTVMACMSDCYTPVMKVHVSEG